MGFLKKVTKLIKKRYELNNMPQNKDLITQESFLGYSLGKAYWEGVSVGTTALSESEKSDEGGYVHCGWPELTYGTELGYKSNSKELTSFILGYCDAVLGASEHSNEFLMTAYVTFDNKTACERCKD